MKHNFKFFIILSFLSYFEIFSSELKPTIKTKKIILIIKPPSEKNEIFNKKDPEGFKIPLSKNSKKIKKDYA